MDVLSPVALVVRALSVGFGAVIFLVNAFRFLTPKSVTTASSSSSSSSESPKVLSEGASVDHQEDRKEEQEPDPDDGRNQQSCCFRCCSTFGVVFNRRRIVCLRCRYFVCKECAVPDVVMQAWICKFCRRNDPSWTPSYDWLQTMLLDRCRRAESVNVDGKPIRHRGAADEYNENDSGYDPALSSATSWDSNLHHNKYFQDLISGGMDGARALEPVLGVREAVEAIVEQMIGSLDDTTLDPLYFHSECESLRDDRMVEIYHRRLRDALGQLVRSLRITLNETTPNATIDEDDVSPMTAHSRLKQIIGEVVEEAECLPSMAVLNREPDAGYLMTSVGLSREMRTRGLRALDYEDLLATAILNKVIDRYQRGRLEANLMMDVGRRRRHGSCSSMASSGRISYSSKEIQTEDPRRDDNAMDDFGWARGIGQRRRPVQYTVEELIEERVETTTTTTMGEDADADEPPISRILHVRDVALPDLSDYGAGLEFAESRRSPFPELDDDADDRESTSSWQDNWSFRSSNRRSLSPFNNLGSGFVIGGRDPIAMFVPNPEENVRARIGGRDVDELSDMSDGAVDVVDEQPSSSSSGDEHECGIVDSTPTVTVESCDDGAMDSRAVRPVPAPRRSRSPVSPSPPPPRPSPRTTDHVTRPTVKSASQGSRDSDDRHASRRCRRSADSAPRSRWTPSLVVENEHRKWLLSDVDRPEVRVEGRLKIDCGLKRIDPSRYRRDYYVPGATSSQSGRPG